MFGEGRGPKMGEPVDGLAGDDGKPFPQDVDDLEDYMKEKERNDPKSLPEQDEPSVPPSEN